MVDFVVQNTDRGAVVKCVHCSGTGICAHSTYTETHISYTPATSTTRRIEEKHTAQQLCNRCGVGVEMKLWTRSTGWFSSVYCLPDDLKKSSTLLYAPFVEESALFGYEAVLMLQNAYRVKSIGVFIVPRRGLASPYGRNYPF